MPDTRPKTPLSAVRVVGDRYYWIVPATFDHLRQLADTLREKDRDEILATGHGIKKTLWRGWRSSVLCRTAIIDGKVAAIWGLCLRASPGVNPLSNLGVPWLHTSAAVETLPISFVKEAKRELTAMLELRPRLQSYVATEYHQAVRLLQIIGFTVETPQPIGINGESFRRFHIGCPETVEPALEVESG